MINRLKELFNDFQEMYDSISKNNIDYESKNSYWRDHNGNISGISISNEDFCNSKDVLSSILELPFLNFVVSDKSFLEQNLFESLRRLDIKNCKLKKIDFVSRLPALESIDFSNNQIKDISPISTLKNLKSISLSNNLIVNIQPIKRIKQLRILHLNNNKIKNIKALKWLFLSGELENGIISKFDKKSKDISLKLYSNPILIPPPSIMFNSNEAIRCWFKNVPYNENNHKKILYLDDDDVGLFVARKILQKANYERFLLITTTDIKEAIEIMLTQKIDLLLLNLAMPIMDGFQVAEYMQDNNINIPTILHTSSVSAEDMERARQIPIIQSWLNKPLNFKNIDVLNEVIERKKTPTDQTIFKEFDLGLTLVDNTLKLVKLYKDGRYDLLDSESNKYQLLHSYNEFDNLKEIIEEFEHLINKSLVKEIELQNFFERNPDFILNDDYKVAHSKFKLTIEDRQSDFYIPDFILEPYNSNSLCDLLEIKLPNVRLFTIKKNRVRYSSAVLEVCAQLREYAAYFEDSTNRNKMSKLFGLNVYKPRMIALIGRRKDIEPIQLKKVESDFPGLQLITYDDVLNKMKRKNRGRS